MKTVEQLQKNWILATEIGKLEARLWKLARQSNLKTILVTSAIRGEGKSTTVAHLATSLAMYPDRKILVMDLDFRVPTLNSYLDVEISHGFDEVLDGRVSIEKAVHCTPIPSLDATFPSIGGADPSLLLRSQRLQSAIQSLKETYDLILLDTPAIIPVADATTLLPHADGVIIVAMAGKTTETQLRRAREICDGMDANILGLVVGNLEEAAPDYVQYSYDGYYGYGEKGDREGRTRRHRRRRARSTEE